MGGMFTIGHVRVDPPLLLAPMAGITDRDFRLIVRRIGGVGVVSMEFVSSKAIVSGNPKTKELMSFCQEERPLAIQIYGSEPETLARLQRPGKTLFTDGFESEESFESYFEINGRQQGRVVVATAPAAGA